MEFNNNFSGYKYAFIETKATWAAHEKAAITWGGHLASVHSDGEQDFIAKRLLELNMYHPFLGEQRISNDSTDGRDKSWKWSDGTNWDYTTWLTGQPADEVEDLIHFFSPSWIDIYSKTLYGGIYKKPYL